MLLMGKFRCGDGGGGGKGVERIGWKRFVKFRNYF